MSNISVSPGQWKTVDEQVQEPQAETGQRSQTLPLQPAAASASATGSQSRTSATPTAPGKRKHAEDASSINETTTLDEAHTVAPETMKSGREPAQAAATSAPSGGVELQARKPPEKTPPSSCQLAVDDETAWKEHERTREALARTSSNSFVMDVDSLAEIVGPRDVGRLTDHCAGLKRVMLEFATTGGRGNLLNAAANGVIERLANRATREDTLRDIDINQQRYGTYREIYSPVGEHSPHNRGVFHTANTLVSSLQGAFRTPFTRQDRQGTADTSFAELNLFFPGTSGHTLLIQRIGNTFDGTSDQYQLYDPSYGVFSYRNLEDLSTAVRNVWTHGYRQYAGVETAQYIAYSYEPAVPARPRAPGATSLVPTSDLSTTLGPSSRPSAGASSRPSLPLDTAATANARASGNLSSTMHAYVAGSASSFVQQNSTTIGDVTGDRALNDQTAGLAWSILRRLARGKGAEMKDAVNGFMSELRDPLRSDAALLEVRLQAITARMTGNTPEDLEGYDLHPGRTNKNGNQLIDDLRERLSTPQLSSDGRAHVQYPFAVVNLSYRNSPGQTPVVIQRLPASRDHASDRYQVYDPHVGLVSYDSFGRLRQGLLNVFDRGYPEQGGVRAASTYFYSDHGSRRTLPGASTSPHDPSRRFAMEDMIRLPQFSGVVPPDVHLPPRPNFNMPASFGRGGSLPPHDEHRKRTDDASLMQPQALYRPSVSKPDNVKYDGGFFSNSTLENINLDLHNDKMSTNPAVIDGGGYLGTFYDADHARFHLKAQGDNGYLYHVAASPNMVDTTSSLGRAWTRAAPGQSGDVGEAAAMGWIAWSQIRGWQKVENGKPGEFQPNAQFRYPVFDRTRTAGARPELSGFAPDHPAWTDRDHAPFVRTVSENGETIHRPNEDPIASTVRFLAQAQSGLSSAAVAQDQHMDYAGPISVRPRWQGRNHDEDRRLAFRKGKVSVTKSSADADSNFYFGTDGRMHSTRNPNRVMRVDKSGMAYIGKAPASDTSLNGVFEYVPAETGLGTLVHQQDGKVLTDRANTGQAHVEKLVALAPGRPIGVQVWSLMDSSGHRVQPPVPTAAFRDKDAGSETMLQQFYYDQNVALPKGTTHFVVEVPGVTERRFGDYFKRFGPTGKDAADRYRHTWDYLSGRNAALLFEDGFHAAARQSASGVGVLEVRRLDGTLVWRVEIDGHGARDVRPSSTSPATQSNYAVPKVVLDRVKLENKLFNEHYGKLFPPAGAARR